MNFLPASHRSRVFVHYCCSSVSMMLEKTARNDFNSKSFAGEPQFRRGYGIHASLKKRQKVHDTCALMAQEQATICWSRTLVITSALCWSNGKQLHFFAKCQRLRHLNHLKIRVNWKEGGNNLWMFFQFQQQGQVATVWNPFCPSWYLSVDVPLFHPSLHNFRQKRQVWMTVHLSGAQRRTRLEFGTERLDVAKICKNCVVKIVWASL